MDMLKAFNQMLKSGSNRSSFEAEIKHCPECGTEFKVGGRGNKNRKQVYCSNHCSMLNQSPRNTGSNAPRPHKKNKCTLHNKDWLQTNYIDQRKSCSDIARELDVSVPAVTYALRKFGFKVRDISEAKAGVTNTTVWTENMRHHMMQEQLKIWLIRDRTGNRGSNFDLDPKVTRLNHARYHNYGITVQQYNEMLKIQGGVCVICGEKEIGKNLAVDHDHLTGKVRGLLCMRCNVTLGQVRENQDILQSMIEYLEIFKVENY